MLDDQVHEVLFSDATLMLGEIHGALLKSAHIMDKERWVPAKTESGFTTHEWTEFGKHVGQDEINWWIVENETNLDELLAITDEALNATQVSRRLIGHSYQGARRWRCSCNHDRLAGSSV